MTLEIILRYVHFVSIFAIVGSLASEHLILKKELTRGEIGRLARIDAVYGIAAVTLLIAGLTLWLGSVGKPAVYYTKNWVFHTKFTLFLIVCLLSIYPTIFFIKNRKENPDEVLAVPKLNFLFLTIVIPFPFHTPLLSPLYPRHV